MASAQAVVLPALIVTPGDIRRLLRELEAVEDFLRQSSLRTGGKAVKLPVNSRLLDELITQHELNLLHKTDQHRLKQYLKLIQNDAPVLHISFASDPSSAFMTKLIMWLRNNIHPQVLVSIGLQPSVTAGCVVRTPNKEFDFSLRQALHDKKSMLVAALRTEAAK